MKRARPISTAPRDRPILVGREGSRDIYVAQWRDPDYGSGTKDCHRTYRPEGWYYSPNHMVPTDPTLWMEIPDFTGFYSKEKNCSVCGRVVPQHRRRPKRYEMTEHPLCQACSDITVYETNY